MDGELEKLIAWAESDLTHFVSLVEEGSAVTGDPWQKGYSDHDISIVVSDSHQSEMAAVRSYLERHPFPDEYLFTVDLASEFLRGDSLRDLSMKFRAKSLAGQDVIADKALPDRQHALQEGLNGLKSSVGRCQRRWLNLAHWSENYARQKTYPILKGVFVFYAAYLYGQNGDYPVKRNDVIDRLPNDQKDLGQNLLTVINDMDSADKPAIKLALESAIELIDKLS